MTILDNFVQANLQIERMVFHLVGPKEESYVRLEEVKPGKFAPFFVERIQSMGGGARYEFLDASSTRDCLARINADPAKFQVESESLAESFQLQHGGTTASGAFLVFVLLINGKRMFALLKYDDETVLTYAMQDGKGGRKRVTLDAIERTFVQNRAALQKIALIEVARKGGHLIVLDRRNPQKVARYFEAFLGAKRIFDDAQLTERLVNATRDILRENRDLVPENVFNQATRRTYDAAAAGGKLDVDGHKQFLDTVMGAPLPDDHPIIEKFLNRLKRERIDGAPISLDASSVKRPSIRRMSTEKGVRISVPSELVDDLVQVLPDRIIIKDHVTENFDDTDRSR